MERGEVRWYKFKPPDKERPVVILTRTSATQFLGEVAIAPITSTIRGIPTEVVLDESAMRDQFRSYSNRNKEQARCIDCKTFHRANGRSQSRFVVCVWL